MGDKKINFIDCYKDFIFTESDQQFFEEKGYSEPIRCKDYRGKKKAQQRTSGFNYLIRVLPTYERFLFCNQYGGICHHDEWNIQWNIG